MKNNYKTKATIVSANGTSVKYDKLLEGAMNFVEGLENRGLLEEEDAKDLQQDSAMKIWQCAKGYDETKSSPKTYGNRAARSCSINAWEKRERFGESFSSYERVDDEGDTYYDFQIDGYRSDENNPERDAVSSEKLSTIWGYIYSLNAQDRLAVEMSIGGFKPKDIAKALGCTPDAASVRLHRVRQSLKANLRDMIHEYGVRA